LYDSTTTEGLIGIVRLRAYLLRIYGKKMSFWAQRRTPAFVFAVAVAVALALAPASR